MAKIKYNERGIARGVDLGFSPMDALKRGLNPSSKNPDAVRSIAKAASRVNVDLKNKPRKNGVYQGTSVKVSMDKDKPKPKASTEGERYAKSLEARSVTPSAVAKKNVQKAAQRRGVEKLRKMDRTDRKRAGDFKGKYWGPDQFKGNQNKIDAWKKAGKPRNADGTPKG